MVGIVHYGTYIPLYRIRVADIAGVWKKDADSVASSLLVSEKSVPSIDEDAVTIALESAWYALKGLSGAAREGIDALFVGSESHPYAVNPTSTIVGELLGIGHDYLAADMQFACKAATAGIIAAAGLIRSAGARRALIIGADAAQSKPHDALEYTSAAAGAAFLLGKRSVVAELIDSVSYSSDTPDFWRRDGIRYPSHAGRFTGEPAYFDHVLGASRALMDRQGISPEDIAHCVFHMPNGKFPRQVARRLGFTGKQLEASLVIDRIGNPYAASTLLGFASVLDVCRPGETVFMASYGSGAGSDAFLWKTTGKIVQEQKRRGEAGCTVRGYYERLSYIDYAQYLKQTHKI